MIYTARADHRAVAALFLVFQVRLAHASFQEFTDLGGSVTGSASLDDANNIAAGNTIENTWRGKKLEYIAVDYGSCAHRSVG